MANVFAITTVTDKLKAETGTATTVFTVTNTTSRPIRGLARIKPIGNTEAAWIKIDGEPERDFPAGGTHQFTVSFNKPGPPNSPAAPQPAESFPFRFDAISSANPDEDFTEGPIVTVEIPEQKVEEKKPFPWLMAGIIAGLLIIVGGVVLFLLLRNTGSEVPDVTTKSFVEAEKELKGKGFTVEKVDETAPDQPLDIVFKQDPVGGSKVAADKKTVKLSVPGTTVVPPLKNLTLNDAIKKLKSKDLRIGNVTGDGDAVKNGQLNQVSTQSPEENKTVAKGTEVDVNFPCVNNPPFKKCFKISDLNDIQNVQVNPNIKQLLESSGPRFRRQQ